MTSARLDLARTCRDAGQYDDACAHYRVLLDTEPDHPVANHEMAELEFQLGRHDAAMASFNRALAAARARGATDVALAVWLRLGGIHYAAGRVEAAKSCWTDVLAIKPDHQGALNNLGATLVDMGLSDQAVELFQRVLDLAPGHVAAQFNLANALRDLGRLRDAEARYRQVLDLSPRHSGALNNLGMALLDLGQSDEAESCFRQAIEIDPDCAAAYANLARTLERSRRLEEALEMAKVALRLQPASQACRDRVGGLQLELGLHAEALATLEGGSISKIGRVGDDFFYVKSHHWLGESDEFWAANAAIERLGGNVFSSDFMICVGREMSFVRDPDFRRCIETHPSRHARSLLWRLHAACWAARNCLRVEGDFVEFGVETAITATAITTYLDLGASGKRFYLYDTFSGIPGAYAESSEPLNLYDKSGSHYDQVRERFADQPHVAIVRGALPDSVRETCPNKIAFAHMDLGNYESERDVFETIFDRLSPGAHVVFQSFGIRHFECWRLHDHPLLLKHGIRILELPTGQGLMIR